MIKASTAVTLIHSSRLLKGIALAVSIVAALLAIWPEGSDDLPARRADPEL